MEYIFIISLPSGVSLKTLSRTYLHNAASIEFSPYSCSTRHGRGEAGELVVELVESAELVVVTDGRLDVVDPGEERGTRVRVVIGMAASS